MKYPLFIQKQIILKQFSSFYNVDPLKISINNPHSVMNLINGEWKNTNNYQKIIDPLNGQHFINSPLTQNEELKEFEKSIQQCPKSGLHNVLKNPEKFQIWGDICFKIAQQLKEDEQFFMKLIQRVIPKSDQQVKGEIVVTRRFFENFSGDNCRYLCKSFQVAGDHYGQLTQDGHMVLLVLQPLLIFLQKFQLYNYSVLQSQEIDLRLNVIKEFQLLWNNLLDCVQIVVILLILGMNPNDMDFINCGNQEMEYLIKTQKFRMTQFTGSNKVAQRLLEITNGKVKIENADWKVFGPDVVDIDYAAWQSDQDAYASTGQKCSAQSLAIIHENWIKQGFLQKIKNQAQKRSFEKGTIGPILSWNNKQIQAHISKLLQIQGSYILFGGEELQNTNIPEQYGSFQPTAIYIPLDQIQKNKDLIHVEVFGPFQIVTEYKDNEIIHVLESIDDHLTAGLVSNDVRWLNYMLSNTVNGVTYAGSRARTTGAPQNHWFGPCGDPRAGGIGTKEAILTTWTSHREIITDYGPTSNKIPEPN